jgi:hypothetical protein
MLRRRFEQIRPLDQRLEEEAKRLRKEAQGTPPGVERETCSQGETGGNRPPHSGMGLGHPDCGRPSRTASDSG